MNRRRLRAALMRALLLAPGILVGFAIATSPDPLGCPGAQCGWEYPLGQRLLYVHVPLAWVAYAGFAAAGIASLLVLARNQAGAGRSLRSLVEVTTLFSGTALATGLAWSYEFALYDPLADPKVVTTVVLVAVLAGLWALSASTPPGASERLVAALTLVGTVTVPASWFASRLASPHPDFTRPESSLDPVMAAHLIVASLGFLILFAALSLLRNRVLALEVDRSW